MLIRLGSLRPLGKFETSCAYRQRQHRDQHHGLRLVGEIRCRGRKPEPRRNKTDKQTCRHTVPATDSARAGNPAHKFLQRGVAFFTFLFCVLLSLTRGCNFTGKEKTSLEFSRNWPPSESKFNVNGEDLKLTARGGAAIGKSLVFSA